MIYCYLRTSTDKQEQGRQEQILKDKGFINGVNCEFIEETFTGTKTSRPLLDKLINETMKQGDTLIVESLSRLSRAGVIKTLDLISDLVINKKINVQVLKEGFYLNAGEKPDANTNLLLGIFAVLGQFERDLTSERTKEGLRNVKKNGSKTGRPIGRPTAKDTSQQAFIKVLQYMEERKKGMIYACEALKFPPASFYNRLKKYYIKYNTKDTTIILNEILKEEGAKNV